jgi:amino acid transporter
MAVYRAVPSAFGKVHRKYLTPTASTLTMGGISIVLYVVMNYISSGSVIKDSVSALGVMIAFYYGLTGFTCAWYYRKTLTSSGRNLWVRGIMPITGGVILWAAMIWSFYHYWNAVNSYTTWTLPFSPHWQIGGVFLIDLGAVILGVVLMFVYAAIRPPFFRGEVLNKSTPTLVPEDVGTPVGLFGIDPIDEYSVD